MRLYQFYRVWADGYVEHVAEGPAQKPGYYIVEATSPAEAFELAMHKGWE